MAVGASVAIATPAEAATKHKLPFPAGESYRITGAPPTGHSSPQSKYALDFALPNQYEVSSTSDGTVYDNYTESAGGKVMLVKTADGTCTLYAHLDRFLADEGEQVRQGQIIAWSGNTGSASTGPHLHLNIVDCQTRVSAKKFDTVEHGTSYTQGAKTSTSQNSRLKASG